MTKSSAAAAAPFLEALAAARDRRQQAEAAELDAVAAAREGGVSWSRIGELYGLTKQGAQQRFKHPGRSRGDEDA